MSDEQLVDAGVCFKCKHTIILPAGVEPMSRVVSGTAQRLCQPCDRSIATTLEARAVDREFQKKLSSPARKPTSQLSIERS